MILHWIMVVMRYCSSVSKFKSNAESEVALLTLWSGPLTLRYSVFLTSLRSFMMLGYSQFLTRSFKSNPSSEKVTQVGLLSKVGLLLVTQVGLLGYFCPKVGLLGYFCHELLNSTSLKPYPLRWFPARKIEFLHWYTHFQIHILSSKQNKVTSVIL